MKGQIWIMVWIVLPVLCFGCGQGGGDKPGDGKVETGDSLSIVKTVDFDRYEIDIPEGYVIIRDKFPGTDALDGRADEIRRSDGGRVIIYYTEKKVGLSLQEMVSFASGINGEGYQLNTMIDSYKIIRLDGRRALLLVGTWQSEDDQGELRAVGLECGGRSYLIEALFKGAWEEEMASIYNSFHCLDD
ncbi:MAG: hypothetical protein KAV42_00095, partial [Candidatus Krumholzibacteria bacterium]|nr:hypothetical protein [Candidatus Krumholzibacteria bacterium]